MSLDCFKIKKGVLKEYTGDGNNVVVPDGVTSVGHCFSFCKHIKEISLPESLTVIGSHDFWCCENLQTITLPDSLVRIEDWAFDGCNNLTHIVLPKNLVAIGYEVFHDCKKLDVYVEGNPICEESSFLSVRKIIAPNLPLSKLSSAKEKKSAAKGFLSNYSYYKNSDIVDEYKKYIMKQKKKLIAEILEEDDVLSLEVYLEIKKHSIKSFAEEYLYPAKKLNAKNCIKFLEEWEDRNILALYGLQELAEFL